MYQFYFFFNATAPTETYTLSLHDALPILEPDQRVHLVGTAGRILIEVPFNIPPGLRARILLFAGGDPPVSPGVEVHETERSEEHTSELQSLAYLVCRLLLEKKKQNDIIVI